MLSRVPRSKRRHGAASIVVLGGRKGSLWTFLLTRGLQAVTQRLEIDRTTSFFLAIGLLASSACGGAEPVRFVLHRDTLLSNGPFPLPLPVTAFDATGNAVSLEFRTAVDRPDVVVVDANSVRCIGTGDARVSVAALNQVQSFRLLCRPVVSFGPPERPGLLVLGQAPEPILPVALNEMGERVGELAFHAETSDTLVASVQGASLVPRSTGFATVRVDFGGIATEFDVEVAERVALDSLRLVAEEWRTWRLAPGRYRAEFLATSDQDSSAVYWRAPKGRCSYAASRTAIHCAFEDSGTISLAASRTVSVVVSVLRRR